MDNSESLSCCGESVARHAARLINRLDRLARAADHRDGLNPAQRDALRYLALANRFSRSPAAFADYLGTTRGTVSQSLIALEAKGYVTREPHPRDRRAVALGLTAAGRAALKDDDGAALLAEAVAAGAGAEAATLARLLEATLAAAIARNGGRAFGICRTCRHFRAEAHAGTARPHHCALLDVPLAEADSGAICVEHERAA
ncbi:MarR family transcriptional regulator [Elioraea sp. Yellowstone]|jgi:DNA-binding MarR family transcriptional regulator|uniref:MarR family winged helix-turn-helix transcriptional regulator n=1 Tax=Elioraea sp. Yellowstone TaxID=2592070 RepID=UPI001153AE18|nr:MarR family transcriptional regulator [Elioraea sp. Yellowstone]TQF77732.1 MarR family transcriptional regulator [Elioraea sp. Yellowstone]